METRNTRKRQLSSPKKSARVGLKFGAETPPKRLKRGSGQSTSVDLEPNHDSGLPTYIEPEPESFNIKSFYGGRQKVHYPHSPGRRKAAAEKVLQRLSTENARPEPRSGTYSGAKLPGGKVSGNSVPQTRKSKATYDFQSSESGDSEGHSRSILKQKNAAVVNKKVPLDIRIKKKPVRKVTEDVQLKGKGAVESPVIGAQLGTPNSSGKKFFKTRSPGAAHKYIESIVIKQGNMKFVSKRCQLWKPKSDQKKSTTGKSKSVKKVNKVAVENKYATIIVDDMKGIGNKENETVSTASHNSNMVTAPSWGPMSPTGNMADSVERDLVKCDSATVNDDITDSVKGDISNESDITDSVDDAVSNEGDIATSVEGDVSNKSDITDSVDAVLNEGDIATSVEGDVSNEGDITDSVDGDSSISVEGGTSDSVGGEHADSLNGDISGSSEGDENDSTLDGSEQSEDSSMTSGSESKTKQKLFPIFTSKSSTPKSPGSRGRVSPKNSPGGSSLLKYVKSKDKKEQMIIDAGQKRYGVTQCELCGMVYTLADPADETLHLKFHQNLLNALKFPGWKKERVVQEYPDTGARVIMIGADDPKYAVRKVDEINRIMGQELGFPELAQSFRPTYKAFLYVSEDKKIEGCCVTEPVSQGYPVIPDAQEVSHIQSGQRPWYCSDESKPAHIGISRIWVFNQARKKGVASKLLDCVRQWSIYGMMISKDKLAFSDPTPDGKIFATKYTGRTDFLVYKYH